MSWEARKQQFIRWYGGYFVNDPQAEVIMFGLVMSRGALRLHRWVRFAQRYWPMLVAAILAILTILTLSFGA